MIPPMLLLELEMIGRSQMPLACLMQILLWAGLIMFFFLYFFNNLFSSFPFIFLLNNTTFPLHPQGCVVSLYSDQETGTPALSTNQTILNSFSSFNDGLLTVSYTRPFITGHHDIRRGDVDQVIWSTGIFLTFFYLILI